VQESSAYTSALADNLIRLANNNLSTGVLASMIPQELNHGLLPGITSVWGAHNLKEHHQVGRLSNRAWN
jgi:hypothetical protein